mmetsp:Transcript_19861/g.42880  ORF Transcript_19861/g.42880 Transcript_19861/m.42880 type:complete len:291 (-) Transcript_19861:1146-2018(-)
MRSSPSSRARRRRLRAGSRARPSSATPRKAPPLTPPSPPRAGSSSAPAAGTRLRGTAIEVHATGARATLRPTPPPGAFRQLRSAALNESTRCARRRALPRRSQQRPSSGAAAAAPARRSEPRTRPCRRHPRCRAPGRGRSRSRGATPQPQRRRSRLRRCLSRCPAQCRRRRRLASETRLLRRCALSVPAADTPRRSRDIQGATRTFHGAASPRRASWPRASPPSPRASCSRPTRRRSDGLTRRRCSTPRPPQTAGQRHAPQLASSRETRREKASRRARKTQFAFPTRRSS